MKTIQECKCDIRELCNEIASLRNSLRFNKVAALSKKIENIQNCIAYLDTSPSEDFLKSEAKKLEKMVKTREEAVVEKYSGGSYDKMEKKALTKLKNKIHAELGTKKLKDQLANIKYILA